MRGDPVARRNQPQNIQNGTPGGLAGWITEIELLKGCPGGKKAVRVIDCITKEQSCFDFSLRVHSEPGCDCSNYVIMDNWHLERIGAERS